ncbi:ketopantoate reductase family protein [Paramaledivibacter caminithermalis]|jgi:2-dehydropantoate 2-reductase|uniref:2-dehydropantoate 2-reductase n=1 Tax=Paramaledivibacter caminithermalis (strain DSM 15212 / CIP 107654 / DViRD3) TaxID=1121301 RepID=A0A1M6NPH6_PARC5|nr:2-dehydropantoate 2-reductase [Paramaledivibacter caminithermalis]SHJ97595.1 ketopantoate reductase [Paramaledivibacter caminithermalis DSM 15212]
MKIAVLGAGAMGCLYGGLLAEGDNEVWLIDIWKEHVEKINKEGLKIQDKCGERIIKNINATIYPNKVGVVDLILVFVKSSSTDKALEGAKGIIGENTIILTLQNGLGNIEKIASVVAEKNIIAGTTAHGSTLLDLGKIVHAGKGLTVLGEINGKITDRVKKLKELFFESGIETIITDNVLGVIWDKLMVNVGINAITAITELRNGELLDFNEAEELLENAVREAQEVAKAKGVRLISENPVDHTKKICRLTANNKSSMLQDIINNRRTEIDMINGAIVKEGSKLDINTPINLVLTNLIKIKERRYERMD